MVDVAGYNPQMFDQRVRGPAETIILAAPARIPFIAAADLLEYRTADDPDPAGPDKPFSNVLDVIRLEVSKHNAVL